MDIYSTILLKEFLWLVFLMVIKSWLWFCKDTIKNQNILKFKFVTNWTSCTWRLVCLTRSIHRSSDLHQWTVPPPLKVVTVDWYQADCSMFGVQCAHALRLIAEIWNVLLIWLTESAASQKCSQLYLAFNLPC